MVSRPSRWRLLFQTNIGVKHEHALSCVFKKWWKRNFFSEKSLDTSILHQRSMWPLDRNALQSPELVKLSYLPNSHPWKIQRIITYHGLGCRHIIKFGFYWKVWTPVFNTNEAHYLCAETAFQSPVFVGLSATFLSPRSEESNLFQIYHVFFILWNMIKR